MLWNSAPSSFHQIHQISSIVTSSFVIHQLLTHFIRPNFIAGKSFVHNYQRRPKLAIFFQVPCYKQLGELKRLSNCRVKRFTNNLMYSNKLWQFSEWNCPWRFASIRWTFMITLKNYPIWNNWSERNLSNWFYKIYGFSAKCRPINKSSTQKKKKLNLSILIKKNTREFLWLLYHVSFTLLQMSKNHFNRNFKIFFCESQYYLSCDLSCDVFYHK